MSDLEARLQRLRAAGRLKRRSGRTPAATGPRPDNIPVRQSEMEEVCGADGCFVLRTLRYELTHQQGDVMLGAVLQLPAQTAAHLGAADIAPTFSFHDAVFLDTETTGLAGGTGTIVFLTGVGRFEEDAYVIRQFFARNPGEEAAYLPHLAELLAEAQAVVSFNGKSFDIPLLRSRFILAGLSPDFVQLPQLDLLHPARRLWRQRLQSCSLLQLEQDILHHRRGAADIPSWLIPNIWFRYARGEGNDDEIAAVLYHNQEDVLSMAPLAHVLGGTLCGLLPPHPHDLISLARHRLRMDDITGATAAYEQALALPHLPGQRSQLMLELASHLKRRYGRQAALSWWQHVAADDTPAAVDAHIELAKYHEWESRDLQTALSWTEQAIARVQRTPQDLAQSHQLAALEHRRQRLLRKLGR